MCSRESAIAEKFEALVSLNVLSSRMKDIYDIMFLAERGVYSLFTLREAIMATFGRRSTQLGDRQVLFSTDFTENKDKETQWEAFLRRSRLQSPLGLSEAMTRVKAFLEPVCSSEGQNDSMIPLGIHLVGIGHRADLLGLQNPAGCLPRTISAKASRKKS